MGATNKVVGTLTIAAVAAAVGGLLLVQKTRLAQQRSPLRVVFDGGSAAGLRKGGPVNFDGVQAGQIMSVKVDSPRRIVVLVTLDNTAPIRKDTTVGIEFQGLTGIAAVSLVGGAPAAPPVPLDADGVPVLNADLRDQVTIVETVHNVDKFVTSNEAAVKDTLKSFESASDSLKSKSDEIDAAVDKAEIAFGGFDKLVTRIDHAIPGFADGNPGELLEKVNSIRELANSFRVKSAKVMDEGRRSLLDVSDSANAMSSKIEGRLVATPASASPPRRGPVRRQ